MQSLRLGTIGKTGINPNLLMGKSAKKLEETNISSNVMLFLSPKNDLFIHNTNNNGKSFRRLGNTIISPKKKYPVGNKKLYLSDDIKNDKTSKKLACKKTTGKSSNAKTKSEKTNTSHSNDSSWLSDFFNNTIMYDTDF